jgi:hypothetical protein
MDLWARIEAEAQWIPALTVLTAAQARSVAMRFVAAFVAVPDNAWWWDALRDDAPTESVTYGDSDAWSLVRQWLPEQRSYVLLVTDEKPTPVGALKGSVADLATLVAECPYFEYVITDEAGTFGIFDSHHNVLIRVGRLPH